MNEQQAMEALTFQPSQEAIELATQISQLLQGYDQATQGKSVIPVKQVSDFALMAQKLLVQYIVQAQTDMAQHTTQVGAFLIQQAEPPEAVTILAIPPDLGAEITAQLEFVSDFCNVFVKESGPAIEKALAADASDEMREDALKKLTELSETATDMIIEVRAMTNLVEETTYEEGDEEEEDEEEELEAMEQHAAVPEPEEEEYDELVG